MVKWRRIISFLKQEFKSFASQMRKMELREVKHCI